MFDDFGNVWTPIELGSRVGRQPLPLTIAGERLVLFRGADDQVAALVDRCPHRGVALSLGKVTAQGAIACPFHGWEFDGRGACLRVPLQAEAKCELLRATALPVRELGELVWLYTAPGATAPTAPEPAESMIESAFHRHILIKRWKTHWTRAMENMLDMPHLPFVHRRTIGLSLRRRMQADSNLNVTWEPTAQGGMIRASLDGQPQEGELEFRQPNSMTLTIPVPGKRLRLHVFCVPVGPQETRMIVVSARDFGRYNPLSRLFDELNRVILLEDQAIVESSFPVEVPPPAGERSVATDKPTLQFRKYYFDVLRASQPSVQAVPGSGMP